MKIQRLKHSKKIFFNLRDLAKALDVSLASGKVIASRYVKAGILIRVKRDLYVLADQWPDLSTKVKFQLANLLQTPSYIYLMTALSYYEISTQIQQNFIKSIAAKRTKQKIIKETIFTYTKLKKSNILVSNRFPKRLKLEIRRQVQEFEIEEKIAFSRFSTKQVLVKAHTLHQTL